MKSIIKNQKGIAFIETLIALVLLGLIGAAFLLALSGASKAIITSDELTISESLARSQMEFIKQQAYDPAAAGGEGSYLKLSNDSATAAGYEIWSVDRNSNIVIGIVGVPWDSQTGIAAASDSGLQKIRLVIKHHGQEVYSMEGYKVDR
jgi:type II secretory pathway pseudopilin PulG